MYSENSPNVFGLIYFLFGSALTTTDKSTTIAFFFFEWWFEFNFTNLLELLEIYFDEWYIDPSVKVDGKFVTLLLNNLLTCSSRLGIEN